MPIVHEIGKTRLHDGQHALLEDSGVIFDRFVTRTSRIPTFIFAPHVYIARVRERWHKTAVAQLRTPAAMIVMQMSTEDVVNVLWLDASRGEAFDVGRIQHVKEWIHVRTTVAGTWIYHENLAVDDHNPALEE